MFSLNVHGTKICHMLDHKTSLNKFQRIEIIKGVFSDHSGIQLETKNNNKKIWKILKYLKMTSRLHRGLKEDYS